MRLPSAGANTQMSTVSVNVAVLGTVADSDTNKGKVKTAVTKEIALKGGVDEAAISGEVKLSGDPPHVMPVSISVPPGTGAETVIQKLREGVDVAAAIEKDLKKDFADVKVYSSAIKKNTEQSVLQQQSQQATIVLDMVIAGIKLDDLTKEQKDLIPTAVQEAITTKGQGPAGDMVLVIGTDAHVTANLHVPRGTEEATMSKLREGTKVAGLVEEKLKEQMKAIPKIDADDISVYSSYLKSAPTRKFYDKKVLLNFVVENIPATGDPTHSEVESKVEDAIVSKGQLDSRYVAVSCPIKAGSSKGTVTITGPRGVDAEARKSQLQSRLQDGEDVAVSIENKLKEIQSLKDKKDLAVYTSPLKSENVAGIVVDLIVDGLDFGKLEDVPALLVEVVEKIQTKILTEVQGIAGDKCNDAKKEDVLPLFPSDMTSGPTSVQAQIAKPDADTCTADVMMSALQDIACGVEGDLRRMQDLKWFVTGLFPEAIKVHTADTKHQTCR